MSKETTRLLQYCWGICRKFVCQRANGATRSGGMIGLSLSQRCSRSLANGRLASPKITKLEAFDVVGCEAEKKPFGITVPLYTVMADSKIT